MQIRRQIFMEIFLLITQTVSGKGGQVDNTVAPLIETVVFFLMLQRGLRVELRRIALHAHDRTDMRRQKYMRYRCQHGVGQVLHHQLHTVLFCPTAGKQGSCLRFAYFQCNAVPPYQQCSNERIQ